MSLTTLAAFWPVLSAGFVNWDDGANFVDNFNFRGLGWPQLRWMWTTFHMGHYQPLSWMTLGLDYLIWGMDPFGYHLTNLLLHCVNAVLFYFVALNLLRSATTDAPKDGFSSSLAALFAALLFAVHPLRVESVAWVTERRDVLSGSFFMATILFYLKACAVAPLRPSVVQLRAAAGCFLLSLLSKGIGMTMPLVLLVLDVYPLRRLPAAPSRWFEADARPMFWEKVPFVAAALPFAAVAFLAQKHTGVIARFASVGLVERFELAAFGAAFYLLKSIAPFHLLPLYARPVHFDAMAPHFLWSIAAVAAIAAVLFLVRKRCPALPAAGAFYLITLSPVLGLVLSGIYLAADRYSYLPSLGLALLAAAGAGLAHRRCGFLGKSALVCLLGSLIVGLVALTRSQSRVWHDSVKLWSYTLSIDPLCAPAHNNLGTALARTGREADAVAEFQSAVSLDPQYAEAHNNLATAKVHQGKLDEAVAEYRLALQADPAYAIARDNLGAVFAAQGKFDEAIAEYRQALAVNPDDAHAHNNWGEALAGQGKTAEAASEFRRALAISPNYTEPAKQLRSLPAGN